MRAAVLYLSDASPANSHALLGVHLVLVPALRGDVAGAIAARRSALSHEAIAGWAVCWRGARGRDQPVAIGVGLDSEGRHSMIFYVLHRFWRFFYDPGCRGPWYEI